MWTKDCFEEWTRSVTALRDTDGGRGIALEGEKGFADGDLNLLIAPRNNLVVATDDAQRGLSGGFAIDRDLPRAIQQEALRDEIGVVVDERFLDELVERVERRAERRGCARQRGRLAVDFTADAGDPFTVGVVENVLLALARDKRSSAPCRAYRQLPRDRSALLRAGKAG